MAYYIEYPKSRIASVRVVIKRPKRPRAGSRWGFAEGPLKTKKDVIHRLNAMSIYNSRRPTTYREPGYGPMSGGKR